MVKTPRTRHSKTLRPPVTIDLEPDQVRREAAMRKQPEKEEKPAAGPVSAPSSPASAQETSAAGAAAPAAGPGAATGAGEKQGAFGRAGDGDPRTSHRPSQPSASGDEGASPARRAGGTGSTLAAGAAGGALALLLAAGLQWGGFLPGLTADVRAPDPALETLRQQVAALSARLDEQREAAGGSGAVDAALAKAAQLAASLEGRIAELGTELAALQETVSSGAAGDGDGNGAGIAVLAARVAALEESARAASGDAGQAVSDRMSTLQANIDRLSAGAGETARSAAGNAAAIAGLAKQMDALRGRMEAGGDAARVAVVIAATALKSAVERGAPFAAELETYAAVAPPAEAEALAPLRAHAAGGVPSRAALAVRAPEAATRIIAAVNRAEGGDGGIIDSLVASARSLVVVRPVGSVEGDGPAAVAARMEAAIIADDYEKALAEYARLPEAGRQAAASLADDLAARLAADRALDKALSSALKGT